MWHESDFIPVHATGVTGDVRHLADVTSQFLSFKRDLWVYLPPGYAQNPSQRYSVLYMHDGNNAFDPSIAFLGREWHLDETAESLIRSGELPPFIIVAVGNTPDRFNEYAWVPGVLDGQTLGGKGASYARFLVEELKPRIDQVFRTLPDRDHTAVMGSSMGGLISLYLGRFHGDTFSRIGSISPSIFWADRAVLGELDVYRQDMKVWLDIGLLEQSNFPPYRQSIQDVREAKRRLEARGYRDGENLGYVEDPQGDHNETSWARRAPSILRFLMEPARKPATAGATTRTGTGTTLTGEALHPPHAGDLH